MNKHLTKLFNNGDVTVKCKDGIKIRCHRFVLESQTAYWQSYVHFIGKENPSEMEVKYSSKIVIVALNRMYCTDYSLNDLDAEEIIFLLFFCDEMQINYLDEIKNDINKIFAKKINEDNWIRLLESTHSIDMFNGLYEYIIGFYLYKISKNYTIDALNLTEGLINLLLIINEKYATLIKQMDPNSKIEDNLSLSMKEKCSEIEIVKYLVENGADISNDNYFPIRQALKLNRINIVQYLISNTINK